MNEKPEALRLAAELELDYMQSCIDPWPSELRAAAAELRRLHELNEKLLTALQFAEFAMDNCPLVNQELIAAIKMARVAIAKAEGK
jgi:hypothetical protein